MNQLKEFANYYNNLYSKEPIEITEAPLKYSQILEKVIEEIVNKSQKIDYTNGKPRYTTPANIDELYYLFEFKIMNLIQLTNVAKNIYLIYDEMFKNGYFNMEGNRTLPLTLLLTYNFYKVPKNAKDMLLNDYSIKLYKIIVKEISVLYPSSIINYNFKKDSPVKTIATLKNFAHKTHEIEINKLINIIQSLENLSDVPGDKEYFYKKLDDIEKAYTQLYETSKDQRYLSTRPNPITGNLENYYFQFPTEVYKKIAAAYKSFKLVFKTRYNLIYQFFTRNNYIGTLNELTYSYQSSNNVFIFSQDYINMPFQYKGELIREVLKVEIDIRMKFINAMYPDELMDIETYDKNKKDKINILGY